jgi:hypothetical protein
LNEYIGEADMEEYVKSIKEEVKTEKDTSDKSRSNYRELFSRFIECHPPIRVESVREGEVSFSISIKDIGLSFQDVQKFRSELYSYLTCNFIGELLVRENIDTFARILTKVDKDTYAEVVNSHDHKKFGLKLMKKRMYLCFHISLVQSILTEDFRREIRKKMERS